MCGLELFFVGCVSRTIHYDGLFGTLEVTVHFPEVSNVHGIVEVGACVCLDIGFPFIDGHSSHHVHMSLGNSHRFSGLDEEIVMDRYVDFLDYDDRGSGNALTDIALLAICRFPSEGHLATSATLVATVTESASTEMRHGATGGYGRGAGRGAGPTGAAKAGAAKAGAAKA